MAAIYSNGGDRWNILGFNFTKRDALSSVYKISMVPSYSHALKNSQF
jgi:opacity protein-like surface antigen